jgi:hypothetical protein
MSQHLFLRAYMAGIVPPTIFSLIVYLGMTVGHSFFSMQLPPVERFIIFPLVVVPNLWGLWNGLRAVMRRRLPLAMHGALLPIINFAIGYPAALAMRITITPEMMQSMPASLVMSMVLYYLGWKFAVSFLNTLVDVD